MLGILARVGNTTARIDDGFVDKWARVVCLLAVAAYLVHGTYAAATHRALYGDAAWFLVRMISEGDVTSFYSDFTREFYYSRFVAYAITQLPALGALHLGVHDAEHLSWVLGATYFAHKPLSLLICYRLLPAGSKGYVLFPLLGLFAGSINSEIYIVTETHLAASFLWPLLIATTQLREPGRIAFVLIALGSVLSALVYESMAFFGPLLIVICLIRATASTAGERTGWLANAAMAVAPTAVNWAAILFPRDPTNKAAFSNGLLKLIGDTASGVASAHILGVASILVLAAVLVALAWASTTRVEARVPMWMKVTAALLALLPAAHFLRFSHALDFTHAITDRGFGGLVMQTAIVGLYLLVIVLPPRVFRAAAPGSLLVVLGLALGQVGWQLLATQAWHSSVNELEAHVASNEGLDHCGPDVFRKQQAEPDSEQMLCHWWVLPLSVVLAPDGGVQNLLVSNESFLPFDPRVAKALPNSADARIDYRPYVAALAKERTAELPAMIEFTSGGDGARYLRTGFSSPEPWATWTDGKVAKLELCFGSGATDPQLTFKLAPLVTDARPDLAAVVDVNGAAAATWKFQLGERIVERVVSVPRKLLDPAGCATVGFTFDDDHRASDIGVAADPRRLGLAFLAVRTR